MKAIGWVRGARGALLFTSVLATALSVASASSAEEEPARAASTSQDQVGTVASADADLARAASLLEEASDIGRSRRDAAIVTGLATAVLTVPTGVALALQSDDVAHSVGIGLTATAGGALFVTALSLRESAAESLNDSFKAWRAAGTPAPELLRRTESAWRDLAASSTSSRATAGATEAVLGGVLTIAGGVFLLGPTISGLDPHRQDSIGAILVGGGVPILSLGIHTLFIKSPEEIAWAAYNAGRTPAAGQSAFRFRVGVAPALRGGTIVATTTF